VKPYYEDAAVTIYHGDCREVLAGLGKYQHVITDPPYEKEAHTMGRRVKGRTNGKWRGERGVIDAPLRFGPMTPELRREFCRLTYGKLERWFLCFCQVEAIPIWRDTATGAGLRYKRGCIWVKPDGVPQLSGDRPGMGYESFVACHARGRSRWNGGGRHGVFIHGTASTRAEAHEHQTVKPINLMTQLVELFTDPGELIVDPFMGSGTTLRAAKDLGRRAVGIELEERYCEGAAKRMGQEVLHFGAAA
jgi:DNA modification methylase